MPDNTGGRVRRAKLLPPTPLAFRAWREERALTREELAAVLGVTASTIYKYEAGLSKKIPPVYTLALNGLSMFRAFSALDQISVRDARRIAQETVARLLDAQEAAQTDD